MAKPCAENLDQEIFNLNASGIGSVVSLLESNESEQLGLQNEQSFCESHGLSFSQFAIPDYGTPDLLSLCVFIEQLHHSIHSGTNTVVHCRGGIGRTGLVCSCLLVRHGLAPSTAIDTVSLQRGCQVPETSAQTALVQDYSAQLANNSG